MPLYDYRCDVCGNANELNVPIADRDKIHCANHGLMRRLLSAPMGKMAGQVAKGGGADRLMAESLGCKIHELPPSLRTPQETCNG